MKLLVAIPSKGRSEKAFKQTLRWVSRAGFDVRIFVEPQDVAAYREAAKNANYQNYLDYSDDQFIDIGENDRGLSYVKGFIKKYAEANGYDLVFKLDDDVLRFSGRGRSKPDDRMVIDFSVMVAACRKVFSQYLDVAAIGFPYRNELYEPKEWSLLNGRLQSCYIVRTEYMVNDERLGNHFEDFHNYIYIRSKNKVTLRYGLLGMDIADVGTNPGGCQDTPRTEAGAHTAIDALRELYPALKVKLNQSKEWKVEPSLTGAFFGVKHI